MEAVPQLRFPLPKYVRQVWLLINLKRMPLKVLIGVLNKEPHGGSLHLQNYSSIWLHGGDLLLTSLLTLSPLAFFLNPSISDADDLLGQ